MKKLKLIALLAFLFASVDSAFAEDIEVLKNKALAMSEQMIPLGDLCFKEKKSCDKLKNLQQNWLGVLKQIPATTALAEELLEIQGRCQKKQCTQADVKRSTLLGWEIGRILRGKPPTKESAI